MPTFSIPGRMRTVGDSEGRRTISIRDGVLTWSRVSTSLVAHDIHHGQWRILDNVSPVDKLSYFMYTD